MRIYWATKLRGFLKHIGKCIDGTEFISKEQFYEVNSKASLLKSKIVRLPLLNPLGVFQIIKVSDKECDCYGSFNRFLNADKPYFIYLENPTALYHYALGRIKYPIGKKKFKKCLENENLKYIVCMSDACRTTFEKVNVKLPDDLPIKTIYPLVPENTHINEALLRQKCYSEELECLYCVQGKRFYTKGGHEVVEVVSRLQNSGLKIKLKIITNIEMLNDETIRIIENHNDISLSDFTLNYDQLEQIYAETAVLIQPSSDDSYGLTVLEAMKGGCAVLGSKLYAIPEMVEHDYNGLIIDPKYWTFTYENLPNPEAWGRKNKLRLSEIKSEKYINDIENALKTMYSDRDKLYSYAKNSIKIANTKFGKETICSQWKEVFDSIKECDI